MNRFPASGQLTDAHRWLLSLLAARPGRRLLHTALVTALALQLGTPVLPAGDEPLQNSGKFQQGAYSVLPIPYSELNNTQYGIRNTSPKSKTTNSYSNPTVQNALRELGLLLPNEQLPLDSGQLAVDHSLLTADRSPLTPYASLLAPESSSQFQVNSVTLDRQDYPAVALDSDGDFVVVWMSVGGGGDYSGTSIHGQRYNSTGAAVGGQFRVNTITTGFQRYPAVAMDSDGDFVVVWQSGGDGSGVRILRRLYNSAGTALDAADVQVNTFTTDNQIYPAVAMDSSGDFVVVWQSNGSSGSDSSSYSIQRRRYNSAGTALDAADVQVNTYTTGSQRRPAVALDSDGDFVVVWQSSGSSGSDGGGVGGYSIQRRLYNSAGTALDAADVQVNTYTNSNQLYPAVAMDSDGDFVVVWQSNGSSGGDIDNYSIQRRRFNNTGTALDAADVQVNTYTDSFQRQAAVALDSDGDFVVIWESNGASSGDTSGYSVQGRAFTKGGLPLWGDFQVNSYMTNQQRNPAVALDGSGDFVVAWQSDGSSGPGPSGGPDISDSSIQARQFDLGQMDHQVNSYTTGNQFLASVALDSSGDFVIVWQSNGSSGGDTSSYSIQGRRYNSNGMPQGSQFQVNSYTTGAQRYPAVSIDSDGDFVVVWQSYGASGDSSDTSIQGQRYNSNGLTQGSQFQVNTYTTGVQSRPAVVMDSDGDFVVVWHSSGSIGDDTANLSIQRWRYDNTGTALDAADVQVNSYTNSIQSNPTVAMDSDGDFVVVWESYGSFGGDTYYSIQGRRYNNAGLALDAADVQINSYSTNLQFAAAVFMDSDGDFVVVWQSYGSFGSDTSGASIQRRRYNSAGTALDAADVQVNSYTSGSQSNPAVALDSNGAFVIVWHSSGSSGSDTSSASIQRRRYNNAGTALDTADVQVNSYTTSNQRFPAVSLDNDGDFVVAWQSNGLTNLPFLAPLGDLPDRPTLPLAPEDDSNYAIAAARFTALGGPEPTALTLHSTSLPTPHSSLPTLLAPLFTLLALLSSLLATAHRRLRR